MNSSMPLSDLIENGMVGFKDFADGTVNRGDYLLPVGLIAMPSPTIFQRKLLSGTRLRC